MTNSRVYYEGKRLQVASQYFIIINKRMFVESARSHHVAHFHAYYQDDIAIYGIAKIERLSGALPTRQERLVLAWAELHQGELLANWEKLQGGHPPIKIEPLK